MILVEGGTFQMRDVRNDSEGYYIDKPGHVVNLTYDYWIGQYPVTFDEYNTYTNATGNSLERDSSYGRGQRPVININWWDAARYCNWLSKKEGISKAYNDFGNLLDRDGSKTTDIKKAEGYRLPTEAEWKYAARGGKKTKGYKYSGSDNLDEVGWYWNNWGNANSKTQPVGQKKANELGIFDMSGNVWEWCHDWYASYTNKAQTNPIGANSGSYRLIRGGSWCSAAYYCRVAGQSYDYPWNTSTSSGFRLARTDLPMIV